MKDKSQRRHKDGDIITVFRPYTSGHSFGSAHKVKSEGPRCIRVYRPDDHGGWTTNVWGMTIDKLDKWNMPIVVDGDHSAEIEELNQQSRDREKEREEWDRRKRTAVTEFEETWEQENPKPDVISAMPVIAQILSMDVAQLKQDYEQKRLKLIYGEKANNE